MTFTIVVLQYNACTVGRSSFRCSSLQHQIPSQRLAERNPCVARVRLAETFGMFWAATNKSWTYHCGTVDPHEHFHRDCTLPCSLSKHGTDRLPLHQVALLKNLSLKNTSTRSRNAHITMTYVEGTFRKTIFGSYVRCRSLASLFRTLQLLLGRQFGNAQHELLHGSVDGALPSRRWRSLARRVAVRPDLRNSFKKKYICSITHAHNVQSENCGNRACAQRQGNDVGAEAQQDETNKEDFQKVMGQRQGATRQKVANREFKVTCFAWYLLTVMSKSCPCAAGSMRSFDCFKILE